MIDDGTDWELSVRTKRKDHFQNCLLALHLDYPKHFTTKAKCGARKLNRYVVALFDVHDFMRPTVIL